MSGITFILSGRSSVLENRFSPPLSLGAGNGPNRSSSSSSSYEIGLVDLVFFNSIPNVTEANNKLIFVKWKNDDRSVSVTKAVKLAIPPGAYELESIEKFLQEKLGTEAGFQLKANNNTLRSKIKCAYGISFDIEESIGPLLGFSNRLLVANEWHEADKPVDIVPINLIRVECNISSGSYVNGEVAHTIFAFSLNVAPGYKMSLSPQTIIYSPINVGSIDHLRIDLVDQDGHPVNFGGEEVTLRLHIREKKKNHHHG